MRRRVRMQARQINQLGCAKSGVYVGLWRNTEVSECDSDFRLVGNTRPFPPVRIDGRTLMDGAIATNTPIRAAADLGASRLIVLPTGYACALKEPPKGALARALHAITLLIEWQLIRDLERLGDEIYVCIVPTLCPLDVSPYDFSASHYLIERAAESTHKWLDRGGLSRRSRPQELQAHRH
jgi:NTE family protein